jgi:peptidoglycan hydrolase CwlO-like protein
MLPMKILRIFVIVLLLGFFTRVVFAQSVADVENRIADLERTVGELQSQQKTLANQINIFNSQISLTTLRINSSKSTITKLTSEIGELNDEIDRLEALKTKRLELVLHRIPETYKRHQSSDFGVFLFSHNVFDFLSRVKYLTRVQEEDAQLYKLLQNTQDTYGERKDLREKKKEQIESLKAQLEKQNQQLVEQKQVKNSLLSETQGKEAVYQQLLSQARAQLAGFASFVDSQGASLLSGQTSCNDWGCYYNQRDSQWGNGLINGQGSGCNGPCTVLRVGCLITSVAMVASHLGHRDISPSDIAFSSPSNFSVGTALLMKGTINVKGVNINRATIAGSLSPDVVKNGPVIVGIYHGQFGTHFVVIKEYTNGNYIMNDPYEAGGHDVSFTSRYSLGSVFTVDRVSI